MWTRLKTWRKSIGSSARGDESMPAASEAGTRVLMVCMGNICRSPLAEGVIRARAAQRGSRLKLVVDSAGTHSYHEGSPPDTRAQTAAQRRGYDISSLRARRVVAEDFERFDLLLAMDLDNLEFLRALAPPGRADRARLFLSFADGGTDETVPDPYYGGPAGFERVLDMVESAADSVLDALADERREPGR